MTKKSTETELKLKQVRSAIGRSKDVWATLRALGLGRIGAESQIVSNPCTLGMVRKVSQVIEVTSV